MVLLVHARLPGAVATATGLTAHGSCPSPGHMDPHASWLSGACSVLGACPMLLHS